jgi:hypothetical protein
LKSLCVLGERGGGRYRLWVEKLFNEATMWGYHLLLQHPSHYNNRGNTHGKHTSETNSF